ncbi:MAG: Cof-type HAD-IIB family hydrolase [Clostridia bacterium]|nr:Cof-type HAD-IIB family hydrolase [Clostridia bacterium]
MKNKIEMLLFDLDDTLLNSKKEITKRTVSAINKVHNNGILIGYITTRSPRKVKEYLKDLPCDAIAYYSGAKVLCNDSVISNICIPFSEGIKLIEGMKEKDSSCRITAYFEPYHLFRNNIYLMGEPEKSYSLHEIEPYDFQRIIITSENNSIDKELISDRMKMVLTKHGNVVITHKEANKGNAVIKIAANLGVDLENIAAFGDDINDIDMFKVCKMKIAMANAVDELKEIADDITDSNDNEGIANWIEKNMNLKHQV